jgi:SpoVK/Ycf46/Vps4 family AAA+-type ATPase
VPDDVVNSLRRAVAAVPDDVPLRLHLADVLLGAGEAEESVAHLGTVLRLDPTSDRARTLMLRALAALGPTAPEQAAGPSPTSDASDAPNAFDWSAAEEELDGVVPAKFVTGAAGAPASCLPAEHVTLADVAGMAKVKERLEAAFLAPLNNPQLRALYGKDLRGGLLLYGPPGCGKTFMARAVAGEMGVNFLAVSLADVLGVYIGQSERNLHEIFETARVSAPCVLFLDEVDALGQKRSALGGSAMRGTVNQLLEELDGVTGSNEGVFVLAATNHPWDVDTALRRPGRFDRMLLVTPPDQPAREALFRRELAERPIADIDVEELARATEGYSGADIVHVGQAAAERALVHSARTGEVRMITMDDLREVLTEVRPSIGPWLQTARNVALFGNDGGEYDDLVEYLRTRRVL